MVTAIKCPTSRPTLKLGAKGQAVRDLQRIFNQRIAEIYTPALQLTVDGDFDSETNAAIKYLQCLAFLTIDGVAGTQTWNFLCNGTSSLPVLKINSTGNTVKAVQIALSDAGFYGGAFDGIFGTRTQTAVRNFQASNSLAVDGIIASKTWAALISLDTHISTCYCGYYGGEC